jgi:hypothetical protein
VFHVAREFGRRTKAAAIAIARRRRAIEPEAIVVYPVRDPRPTPPDAVGVVDAITAIEPAGVRRQAASGVLAGLLEQRFRGVK